MRAERPILLRFLNVLTSLNDFIIKRIVFLFLVKYIASGTLNIDLCVTNLFLYVLISLPAGYIYINCTSLFYCLVL